MYYDGVRGEKVDEQVKLRLPRGRPPLKLSKSLEQLIGICFFTAKATIAIHRRWLKEIVRDSNVE